MKKLSIILTSIGVLFLGLACEVPQLPTFEIPQAQTPWQPSQNLDNSGITGASCVSTGSVSITSTIRVGPGETFDGRCQTFNPSRNMGTGNQDEDQDPAFIVDGGTLKNVIIGNNGVDGVHLYGGRATVDNITYLNVGEDAMTVKEPGTYTVRNIEGYDGEDKFFQLNAKATLNVTNCIIHNAGKGLRENGGKNYPIHVTFDRCEVKNMKEAVARSDGGNSTFRITNSRVINSKFVCKGAWANANDCRVENTQLTGTQLYTK